MCAFSWLATHSRRPTPAKTRESVTRGPARPPKASEPRREVIARWDMGYDAWVMGRVSWDIYRKEERPVTKEKNIVFPPFFGVFSATDSTALTHLEVRRFRVRLVAVGVHARQRLFAVVRGTLVRRPFRGVSRRTSAAGRVVLAQQQLVGGQRQQRVQTGIVHVHARIVPKRFAGIVHAQLQGETKTACHYPTGNTVSDRGVHQRGGGE